MALVAFYRREGIEHKSLEDLRQSMLMSAIPKRTTSLEKTLQTEQEEEPEAKEAIIYDGTVHMAEIAVRVRPRMVSLVGCPSEGSRSRSTSRGPFSLNRSSKWSHMSVSRSRSTSPASVTSVSSSAS